MYLKCNTDLDIVHSIFVTGETNKNGTYTETSLDVSVNVSPNEIWLSLEY